MMRFHKHIIFFLLYFFQGVILVAQPAIYTGTASTQLENYAALELQRYTFQLTGRVLPLKKMVPGVQKEGFVIGTASSNKLIQQQFSAAQINECGDEGYFLQKKEKTIYIAAQTEKGCMYGVYGLLEDYYNVGFYMGGDVLPSKTNFFLPDVNETKKPSMAIRGFLPWTNFPQSATVYSWSDWKFIIDQAAKMRMNFIQIHNYNGQEGHNEMFHNFLLNGITSRVWMPTAKTGHKWNCPGFDIQEYRFGGEDLFDDYDFGSDCALHNEKLGNEMVFRKGVSLFKRVIAYAHSRGIRMALGLDIDLIMPDYQTTADDPKVIEARMKQVTQDYPDLDYLVLFISELINNKPDKLALWKRTFDGMYAFMKQHSQFTKVAVAGWGLSKEIAAGLPADVIAAPISHYSDGFEDGSIYGEREYWGCPWMERDFFSSEYYYPYDMHLSNTIKAWNARAKNMKGFYTLTWRLTDAIDPKISFVAKAPWDDKGKYKTSYDVYYDYALKNYGEKAAKDLTGIINENEPFSCNDAECQPTGSFTGKPLEESNYLLNIHKMEFKQKGQTVQTLFATRYNNIYNCGIEKREDADSCVAFVKDHAYIKFTAVQFGSADSFTGYAATAYPFSVVDIRLDSVNGQSLAVVPVPTTGGWHNWKSFTAAINHASGVRDVYFVFKATKRLMEEAAKGNAQIKIIEKHAANAANKDDARRMKYVQARIKASQQHLFLSSDFPHITKAAQTDSLFSLWVKNFTHRVTDISSLGNVQSVENRYVQERYLAKENELLKKAAVKFPTRIVAKGTKDGAIIRWKNNEPGCKGFHIYADGIQLNSNPIPAAKTSVHIAGNKQMNYQLRAISQSGAESELSAATSCYSGDADAEAPHIVLISPPQSVKQGSNFSVKVQLLDNRAYHFLNANFFYRNIGETTWKNIAMQRKTKAIFTADIPCDRHTVIECFIEATDGKNRGTYPAQKGSHLTVIVEPLKNIAMPAVLAARVSGKTINWPLQKLPATSCYRIYRSKNKTAAPSTSTLLTYLPPEAVLFEDNGIELNGKPLKGTYYYTVRVVDIDGIEKSRSVSFAITY
jgi:hypothetical protein